MRTSRTSRPVAAPAGSRIRPLTADDLAAVVRLDAELTGARKQAYWKRVLQAFLAPGEDVGLVGLAAEGSDGFAGYVLGEVRAFEFGSESCGWIFAVGVAPWAAHGGVGSALVAAACECFHAAGASTVRTMVKRDDLPMLSFFRANDFVGGSYVELERHVPGEH